MEKKIWPQGYQCGVMISVNLDAEFIWTSMYPQEVTPTSALYHMGESGMLTGLDRVLDVLEKRGIKATFFVPGKTAQKYPDQIRKVFGMGHEIACHGYAHENLAQLPPEQAKERLEMATQILTDVCGKRPVGFRAPEGEIRGCDFREIKKLGYVYSSTLGDDCTLYDTEEGLIEIPIHFSLCDFVYFASNIWPAFPYGQDRIPNYDKVLTNWKWEFDGFRRYGGCYVLQIDPQIIGVPGRVYMLEAILDYIQSFQDGLFVTGSEAAERYCKAPA